MKAKPSKRNIGVNFNEEGEAEIAVWAPLAEKVKLVSEEKSSLLTKNAHGHWTGKVNWLKPGDAYSLSVDEKKSLPDPASLLQANGVHGPSTAFDLRFDGWTDSDWKNIPFEQYIIYEIHTGTFSESHDFEGIKKKLGHLSDLGVNAIEIMPVGQFPGTRNWGYDGVYPFAVQDSYGGARALQELVDACHAKGIAVILDVIYNHLGPEGNYLGSFGPYFTDKYNTPWGKAINFDDAWCDGVREYFTENAMMWFRDFHIDALRMDAVHAIKDLSPVHLLKHIRQCTDELMSLTGRNHYLIVEMDLNNPVFINGADKCGYGMDAQWLDEFHHALRVSAGQKKEGYYEDFDGIAHLAKSYSDAYVFDGQFSFHRKKNFGVKTSNPGKQFIVFSQNHDHTGNRMLGERTSVLHSPAMCRLLAGAVMVSPYVPMLFMGEEWAEEHPFLFFISHTDEELAALVNKGRREEFSTFNWEGEPPDPRVKQTFENSSLQWQLLDKPPHKSMLEYYKRLIHLRKTSPALRSLDRNNIKVELKADLNMLEIHRWAADQYLICYLNFSGQVHPVASEGNTTVLLDSSDANRSDYINPESILIIQRH